MPPTTSSDPHALTLLRAGQAPEPRTLVEVFRDTAAAHPDAAAIDTGGEVLTYAELTEAAEALSAELVARGVRPGDRVGLRAKSGTSSLYVAVLGILGAAAAYVPADVDDPDERARLVFDEAGVVAVVGNEGVVSLRGGIAGARAEQPGGALVDPTPDDDAWVIFTSGSTGTPKGVAVSHRSAAAFVDAEADLFLTAAPLGPGDRVMAGLSVAFDASCEEIWLAWAHGACLVPAPRSLVRTGVDVGPWLVANAITVVSTVPTLVSLWPTEALDRVRLLILGGEACPPEIGARLCDPRREVWNTYGPTEATVVSCGALLSREGPVRIGTALAGWDLAVVDEAGQPVPHGEVGELIIGGVGLARYLDPAKDAEKFAAMPSLGWARAYRSGDRVRFDGEGLLFAGRADDQVKVQGRRIELGEIDSALLALPGVTSAAAAVRRTPAGNEVLVGYVTTGAGFDPAAALDRLRAALPAPMVPRLAAVAAIPTRTSGKVDRDALPWPLPGPVPGQRAALHGDAAWVAQLWLEVIGATVASPSDDFFDLGGGSLTAAQVVSRLRTRYPEVTVADLYENPTVEQLVAALDALAAPAATRRDAVLPTPPKTQAGLLLATLGLRSLTGLRWLTWVGLGNNTLAAWAGLDFLPTVPWGWVLLGWALLVLPVGRMALSVLGARVVLRGVTPGSHPRGGKVHLRVWLAERLADELGATHVSGAAWIPLYARALGAEVGRGVDLHSLPPVTGMLRLGDGCSIEPEVDLSGHWVDGDEFHLGILDVGADSRVGTRSCLLPGAHVGRGAEVGAGSSVLGRVPAGEFWSGAPAVAVGTARGPWSATRPRPRPWWTVAYAAAGLLVSLVPVVAVLCGALVVLPAVRGAASLGEAVGHGLPWLPVGALVGLLVTAGLAAGIVRAASVGLTPGHHPVQGRQACQAWLVLRVLDECRTWLFPLYASALTPAWLRLLGAKVGRNVEASTVLLLPSLTTINDEAFLADDTLLGSYELGGGYLRVERVKIGKRAFLGNSGMAAPGRKVPREALVAVLSAAPRRKGVKAGSSWLGSPPVLLRRPHEDTDAGRTYAPSRGLRAARATVELCRLVPVLVAVLLTVGVVVALEALLASSAPWVAVAVAGLLLMVGGALAAVVTTAAKWALVGRHVTRDHPLWSSFVWRNEVADAFVEVLAAPWFAGPATGTPALNLWLRSLGARIGKGVWCESYWLPEPDLVVLRDGVTVNRGCVLQTHLFHDRVMSLDRVTLRAGATLGPHSVVLPAAEIGRHATVGPVSLVMRGETVPDKTRWIGNPIGPWLDPADQRRAETRE